MNIIIPVAGEGVRLKPHTHILPKCLLFVAGKPILGHILDAFRALPVDRLVIILGAKGDQIKEFCRRYRYSFRFVTQPERRGLGHAVYLGSQGLKGPTMVLLGDTIIDINFKKFCSAAHNVLALKAVQDPRRFGIAEIRGRLITNLVEKPEHPKSNLALVGLYYFQEIRQLRAAMAEVMRRGIKTRGEYQLTDGLRRMLQRGVEFQSYRIDRWFDCGTAEALIETNRHLLKKMHYCQRRPQVIVNPPVYIPDSARIENSIIGPNVSVGEKAVIRNSILRDSIINHEALVENDLLINSIIGGKAAVRGAFKKVNVGESSVIELP